MIDQRRDARLEGGQCLAGEGVLKQFADARVIRRINEYNAGCVMLEQRRVGAEFGREIGAFVAAPQNRTTIGLHDVVIARQHKGTIRVAMNRIVFAQSGVISIRIGDEISGDGQKIKG